MIQKKICMLGSFAVGKTSLVARFVHSVFSEKYLTTIGVKIDRKQLEINGTQVSLLLWDIHGDDEFQRIRQSYLRGMSAYFLVMDGTRPETLETAAELHEVARQEVGVVPFLALINKSDLKESWILDDARLNDLAQRGWSFMETSAKSGIGVEEAFRRLTQDMLSHDLTS
jgi:hypothetical protein